MTRTKRFTLYTSSEGAVLSYLSDYDNCQWIRQATDNFQSVLRGGLASVILHSKIGIEHQNIAALMMSHEHNALDMHDSASGCSMTE